MVCFLARPFIGDLCQAGLVKVNFTTHMWPEGTKRDRGLNVSFPSDLFLGPGQSVSGGHRGRDIMFRRARIAELCTSARAS